jgi:hypothetical protein
MIAGGAFAVLLLVWMNDLVGQVYLNADAASAPMIAELIGQAPPDRVVTLAKNPWYEALWFMQLTHDLPAHRQIWLAAPIAFSLLGGGCAVWMAARVLGRWEAAMVAVLLLCTIGVVWPLIAPNFHGTALTHACVLGAVLLWWTARAERLRPVVLAATAVALTLFTIAGTATDSLLLVAGVGPFAGAALLTWHRHRSRPYALVAAAAVAVALVSVAGGAAVASYMKNTERVVPTDLALSFVSSDRLPATAAKFVDDFSQVGNGSFFGREIDTMALVGFASGLLTLLALVLVARRIPGWLRGTDSEDAVRSVYTSFWVLVILAVAVAYIFTSVALDQGGTYRYLIAPYFAVAALLPVVVARFRAALAVGVALFAVLGCVTLVDLVQNHKSPLQQTWNEVTAYARDNDLKYGYSGYWDASSLTWASEMDVQVFPVSMCRLPEPSLCPIQLHTISTWYTPRPDTRTFLLTHPGVESTVDRPDPEFGKPTDVVRFSNQVTMHVYDSDIAARFKR